VARNSPLKIGLNTLTYLLNFSIIIIIFLARDMTGILRKETYWASYNVAAFPEIFNISGNLEMVKKYGNWFTYDKTPRALIFKRDHGE